MYLDISINVCRNWTFLFMKLFGRTFRIRNLRFFFKYFSILSSFRTFASNFLEYFQRCTNDTIWFLEGVKNTLEKKIRRSSRTSVQCHLKTLQCNQRLYNVQTEQALTLDSGQHTQHPVTQWRTFRLTIFFSRLKREAYETPT